jgi:enoyl-CoA hydratase
VHNLVGPVMSIVETQPLVLASIEGALGRLTLNRPAALHALTLDMVTILLENLMAWKDDARIQVIMLDHSGARGFCAGGDIAMLAASGAKDSLESRAFFHAEYRLNDFIHRYPKPIVAIMDGIVMGGGVGLSIHAPVRIATDRSVFAMPETGIGLFPDVGGGWFLPRLTNEIGIWLALTGVRLKAADMMIAGLATHYIPTELLGAVKAQIGGAASAHDPRASLSSGLAALEEEAGPARLLTTQTREVIKTCFCFETIEEILEALRKDPSEWANEQYLHLQTRSPQTLKVALRQMRAGARAASFGENMAMEYRIGARVVSLHDFQEGVRAVIVDKDNQPKWKPCSLAGVTDELLDMIFAPLPPEEEWTPLP